MAFMRALYHLWKVEYLEKPPGINGFTQQRRDCRIRPQYLNLTGSHRILSSAKLLTDAADILGFSFCLQVIPKGIALTVFQPQWKHEILSRFLRNYLHVAAVSIDYKDCIVTFMFSGKSQPPSITGPPWWSALF